jgi:hypothetical protein
MHQWRRLINVYWSGSYAGKNAPIMLVVTALALTSDVPLHS